MSNLKSRVTPHSSGEARIMVTDGGAHPPEFWAQVTAEHIAPINDAMTGHRRIAALALQAKIAEALEPHHAKVQSVEAGQLKTLASHADADPNPEEHLDDAMAAIQAAAKGTEWEGHLTFGRSKPGWMDEYLAEIDRLGVDNYALHHPPLTQAQRDEMAAWQRQKLIRQEIGTHFATAQHIAKSWHKDGAR